MPLYHLTRKDGKTATIDASSFVSDGAGTRFYAEDGSVLAAFGDGQITTVARVALAFADPASEAKA